jgi:hypothetical protein
VPAADDRGRHGSARARVVFGAGVAGLQAIATAKRLGCTVEATDVRMAAREQVLSLGAKFIDVPGMGDMEGSGGYAKEQSAGIPRETAPGSRQARRRGRPRHHDRADPRPPGAQAWSAARWSSR